MSNVIKYIVVICSFLIGIGLLIELDQSDDMDIFATLITLIVLVVANMKIIEQKKISN